MAQLLLNSGADVNAAFPQGSVLHTTASNPRGRSREMAVLLVGHGANIELRRVSDYDATPIQVAASWGNVEVLRVLLDAGADTSVLDSYGSNVLKLAVSAADRCEVPMFLKHASVEGCREARREIISALLKAGVKPTEANDSGTTALDAVDTIDGPIRARVETVFVDHGWATSGP